MGVILHGYYSTRCDLYTECEGRICISLNNKFDCVLQGKHPSKSLTNCANDTEETSYHHNHIPQL